VGGVGRAGLLNPQLDGLVPQAPQPNLVAHEDQRLPHAHPFVPETLLFLLRIVPGGTNRSGAALVPANKHLAQA